MSVPYAYCAGKADQAASVAPDSVDNTALADDAVTEQKIGVVCPNTGEVLVWDGNGWSCAPPPQGTVCPARSFINCYSGPAGTPGVGICLPGSSHCKPDGSGFDACTGEVLPAAEVCDGLDNDCDGTVDDGNPGGGGACSTGLLRVCSTGTTTCSAGSLVCQPDNQPTTEVCDGVDNDCDGSVDEGGVC